MSKQEQREHDQIRSRTDFVAFLQADCEAHDVEKWRWWMRATHPELYFQRILRRVEYFSSCPALFRPLWMASRFQLARASVKTGISIPPGVFGRGLSIAHFGSIVVNNNARVGKYCRLHSATNIGVGKNGSPEIGDFVYVAPGAVISGGITIGSRSAVGANAVVLSSIPEGGIAVGVPARTVSQASSFEAMPTWIQRKMMGPVTGVDGEVAATYSTGTVTKCP